MPRVRSAHHRIASNSRPLQRARGWLSGGVLLVALASACGGQSLSTDTGNPPVVGQKLRLTATPSGVIVSGEPGSVPPGAYVEVVNASNALTAGTQAAVDGSFAVEVIGTTSDEYRVYVSSGQESWRTRLTAAGATAPQGGLDGRSFRLSAVGVDLGMEFLPGALLELSFEEGQLSFSAGCNSYSGSYAQCDGRLCVTQITGTDRACESALHDQDAWLVRFLEASPVFSVDGASIRLGEPGAGLMLTDREAAEPDKPLAGRIWIIGNIIEDWTASSPGRSIDPFLEFEPDGTFRVFSTCNEGEGTYVHSGQTLTLSSVSYTPFVPYVNIGGCPEVNLPIDQHIQRVVREGQLSVAIGSTSLVLMRGRSGLTAETDR